MKGIFLEGVSTSGKSTISKHMRVGLQSDRPSSSLLFLSEHYTQRALEHLKESQSITSEILFTHLSKILDTLEHYQKLLNQSKFVENPGNAEMFIIGERFLITHLIDSCIISVDQQKDLLQRLYSLNIKYIVIKIPEDEMSQRISSSMERRDQKWREYLLRRCGGMDGIIKYHIDWQNKCLKFADDFANIMDIQVIEVPHDSYKEKAEDFLKLIL